MAANFVVCLSLSGRHTLGCKWGRKSTENEVSGSMRTQQTRAMSDAVNGHIWHAVSATLFLLKHSTDWDSVTRTGAPSSFIRGKCYCRKYLLTKTTDNGSHGNCYMTIILDKLLPKLLQVLLRCSVIQKNFTCSVLLQRKMLFVSVSGAPPARVLTHCKKQRRTVILFEFDKKKYNQPNVENQMTFY